MAWRASLERLSARAPTPTAPNTKADWSSSGSLTKRQEMRLRNSSGAASYAAALPDGYSATSKMWGDQLALQLPTRWFTLVASAYKGGDLRFMFGGQAN